MRRGGFTLVELLVGVLIAGLGVSVAVGVFLGALDAVRSMSLDAERAARRATSWTWLTEALLSASVSPDSSRLFRADSDSLSFFGTLRVPPGWTEATQVNVSVSDGEIRLMASSGLRVLLADSLREAHFDYLTEYGAESLWLPRWESFTRPPLAVRLRYRRRGSPADTLLFYVGGRG
jgi:prepilin-type N-terminal cleavage/methylation domain-containing protein